MSDRLETDRRPAREIRAFSVAYDLRQTTNSKMLVGTGPEFKADLGRLLAWPTWGEIDHSPPRDRGGCIRLILTNDHGQALHMRLQEERDSGEFRFRLLSYRSLTEPGGAANQSQPVRRETNQSSAAAGSGR